MDVQFLQDINLVLLLNDVYHDLGLFSHRFFFFFSQQHVVWYFGKTIFIYALTIYQGLPRAIAEANPNKNNVNNPQ